MLKVKNNAKFLVVFAIMLVAMFIFNMNTVNAAEPTQEMLDLIPNEITLDIPEIEYEKADKLIEQKVKEIWQSNSMSTNGIDLSVGGTKLAFENIHTADISINNKKVKTVSVVYNNTNQKNSTDEQYVKNLMSKVKSPQYYEVDLDFYTDATTDWDSVWNKELDITTKNYIKQINDNSVVVKCEMSSGGINGDLNILCNGTLLAIFKNDILYELKNMGREWTIPVINVSNTIPKSEVKDYVIDLIKKDHKRFGENIIKIEKGTSTSGIDIPNGYTIYPKSEYDNIPSYVIINGVDIEDTTTNNNDNKNDTKPVVATDNKTNIKLETNDGVVPSNTVLEVQPITEGKIFDNVKKVLSNVNKFKVFDITLKSNGVEIQPNGKVKISIPIPQDFDTLKLMVYRIEGNGKKISYKVNVVTIDNVKYAQFETDHFSTYVLAETEPNSNEKDNTPKTGTETNAIPYVLGIVATIGIAFIIKRK